MNPGLIGAAAMVGMAALLLFSGSDNKRKRAMETMTKLIEELEILSNNVRDPAEMQRVTMRATVLGTKLLGELLEAMRDGLRINANKVDTVVKRLEAVPGDTTLRDLLGNIQRIADKVDPPAPADPWKLPQGLAWRLSDNGSIECWSIHDDRGVLAFVRRGDRSVTWRTGSAPLPGVITSLLLRRIAEEPNGPRAPSPRSPWELPEGFTWQYDRSLGVGRWSICACDRTFAYVFSGSVIWCDGCTPRADLSDLLLRRNAEDPDGVVTSG